MVPVANSVRRVVVLGTGTGVGKSWVAVGLTRALRDLDQAVWGLKPIESGVSAAWGSADGSDAAELGAASSSFPSEPPYRLPEPLSPHLAARRAGTSVQLESALRYVQSQDTSAAGERAPWVVVETAGALLSPLAEGVTNWDLARGLDPAIWVLVAPDALGVLHDLSATLEILRERGRPADHVVLSAARAPDASTGSNATELERLGIVTPAATFHRDGREPFAQLARLLLLEPASKYAGTISSSR